MARRGRPKGSTADIAILKGAAVAFARLGYARCRIEDIAQDSGVSRTNLYRHFANKDDVYRQLVTRELRYALQSLDQVIADLPADLAGPDKIRRVIARDVDVAFEAGPFLRTMYAETGHLSGYEELWAWKNETFSALIADLLVKAGYPAPDRLLLGAVLTGIEHVLIALPDIPGDEAARKAVAAETIWRMFAPLITPPAGQ